EPVLPAVPDPDAPAHRGRPHGVAEGGPRPACPGGRLPPAVLRLGGRHDHQDRHLRADRSAPVQVIRALRHRGLRWRAMLLLVLGRQDAALALLDHMLAEFPGDAYALASVAHLQAQRGDRAAALRTLEVLLQAQPQQGAHWFNYGFV